PFERPRRIAVGSGQGSSLAPLQDLVGIVTPADLHFERHHAGVPTIDPHRYKLLIHGMVERPQVFDLNALKRFPAVSRLHFLECSGNGSASYRGIRPNLSPQLIDGLTSTSEWSGVPLALLFREVGVKPGAKWFLAEGDDAAVMSRSIPMEKAWDDALIAYGQNGEALRPEQGYPARLFLPGWEGNANIKWIRRIEIADRPFMTREETSKYTDPLGDGTARMFSFVMDAKSIITFPAYPVILHDRGWWEIGGIAWSGRGRITRVDVSTDGGKQWEPADLQQPVRGTVAGLVLALAVGGSCRRDGGAMYGFGKAATPADVSAWDIDVMPDGTGLPPGSGTAPQGAAIYSHKCAACHGPTGTEGPSERLVGREPRQGFPFGSDPRWVQTIGNYWPYATTLYD